jgi:hypothetical protein
MLKMIPGVMDGAGDPVAAQLDISAMMPGPKYGGIVRGLDRGHVLDRLELCCGNLNEALHWLEIAKTYWPQIADEAKTLLAEGQALAEILAKQKRAFDLGLHELDGEDLPWKPLGDDELDDDNHLTDADVWGDEGEEPD